MKYARGLFLATVSLLTACGEGRTVGDPRYVGGSGDPDIVGIWQSNCEKLTDYYNVHRLHFGNDYSYHMQMRHYSDSNCQTFVKVDEEGYVFGDYVLGSALTASDGTSVREIDIREHLVNHDTNQGYSRVLKTVYYLRNNILYLGPADYDASSRPAGVSFDMPFTKQ